MTPASTEKVDFSKNKKAKTETQSKRETQKTTQPKKTRKKTINQSLDFPLFFVSVLFVLFLFFWFVFLFALKFLFFFCVKPYIFCAVGLMLVLFLTVQETEQHLLSSKLIAPAQLGNSKRL